MINSRNYTKWSGGFGVSHFPGNRESAFWRLAKLRLFSDRHSKREKKKKKN